MFITIPTGDVFFDFGGSDGPDRFVCYRVRQLILEISHRGRTTH